MEKCFNDPSQKFIPEVAILLRLCAEYRGIERDNLGWFPSGRCEMPLVRGEQPRPAKRLPGADVLNCYCAASRDKSFQRDAASEDEIEVIGVSPFAKDLLLGSKAANRRAVLEDVAELRAKTGEERVFRDKSLKCIHSLHISTPFIILLVMRSGKIGRA